MSSKRLAQSMLAGLPADGDIVLYARVTADQHRGYVERARSIDRSLSWWVRAVLDYAVRMGIGDPRQLDLPFDGPVPIARPAMQAVREIDRQIRAKGSRRANAKKARRK